MSTTIAWTPGTLASVRLDTARWTRVLMACPEPRTVSTRDAFRFARGAAMTCPFCDEVMSDTDECGGIGEGVCAGYAAWMDAQ